MKKTRNIGKSYLKLASLCLLPCALFVGGSLAKASSNAYAEEKSYSYSTGCTENVNVTNPSFASGSSPYATGPSLSGWNAVVSGSKAKGMIINVGDYVESDDGTIESATFAKYKSTYLLDSNPMTKDKSDTRILMINSKSSNKQQNVQEKQGYQSSTLTLKANSYYVFSVSALTMLNGDNFAECSIYLSGLVDENGKKFDLGYEKISPTSWTDYYFFVATGNQDQEVSLQLYLGSKTTASEGVALFDGTSAYRYSENEFFNLCYDVHGYNASADEKQISDGEKIFMIKKLKSEVNSVEDIATYNFDFESTSASLADNWSVIAHPNGTASIINYADFESVTSLPRIGNDLSYNNNKALVMQTTQNEYSSSYIGLKSKQIEIKPHASYKVSLKLKIAEMESGSFFLKLTENDYIYEVYSSLISEDENDDNYLALSSGKTSGYTSNTTDQWTNDYQTVDFYVKGHSLYTSFVNVELWLGDKDTSAVGCVVIDDINVETIADSELNSANCLTLNSNTTQGSIENSSFDTATSTSNSLEYPLNATGWTANKENDVKCESGVVYLDKNTYAGLSDKNIYDTMYEGKHDWAGINPGNSDKSNSPANVYMMFNRQNSYQSLQSPYFTLSGNEYYKVSFDYYNQLFSTTNPSQFKVELVDDNGITLFSQDKIQSLDEWKNMEIYFKTNSSKSHKIYAKIYFGEQGNEVGGMLYLDNFDFASSTQEDYANALYSTDTTGFYTKLDSNLDGTKVVSSTAYSFSATSLDSNYANNEVAFGGIASGTNNAYDITNEKDNLLVVTTTAPAKASLKSKFNLDFKANTYYKLTFDLATIFNEGADKANSDEHTCNYGASILLDNFEEISGLISDGSLNSYTIYFKTKDIDSTPTLQFILNSDCDETTGTAVLTNLELTTSDEDTYVYAQTQASFNKSVFASEYVEQEVEDEKPDEELPEDEQAPVESNPTTGWMVASGLITGIAVLIAIIGLIFKNVKIKKIEKVKSEAYDRRINKNHELIMAEAQKLRDNELQDLIQARDSIQKQKDELEASHKEYMKSIRDEKQGKISKAVEKEFKKYTSMVATLNEKINIIKEKMDYTMSADHLIELGRKVVMQQEASKKI